jgi:hypothetical protein
MYSSTILSKKLGSEKGPVSPMVSILVTTDELGGTELGTLPALLLGGIIENQNADFATP